MNKRCFVIVLCCILLFCGCNANQEKYKRISFKSDTLSDNITCITANTVVTYSAENTFQETMPVYKINKHAISEQEFKQMEENFGITKWHWNEFDGYTVYSRIAPYSDSQRGHFYTLNMTDEELEALAWETFNKIPFMTGDYEYVGKTATMTEWTMEKGEYVTEVTISFYRQLNGVGIVGNEQCDLTFDASGLVEIYIAMYDYQKIGTMDMVSLRDAQAKIKTPDSFSINQTESAAKELHVNRTQLFWVNQFSEDCTILQPIYTFYGTAHLENGEQTEFRSRVIAIPESMTYVEE